MQEEIEMHNVPNKKGGAKVLLHNKYTGELKYPRITSLNFAAAQHPNPSEK